MKHNKPSTPSAAPAAMAIVEVVEESPEEEGDTGVIPHWIVVLPPVLLLPDVWL